MDKALRYADSNYLEICRRRLRSCGGLNYTVQELRNAIGISAILHDVGKATDKYQLQFDDTCNLIDKKRKPSFYLHEVSSAVLANRICKFARLSVPLSFFIVSSVLQHLHTMRGMDRRGFIQNSVIKLMQESSLRNILCSQQLYDAVKTIMDKYDITCDLQPILFTSLQPEEILMLFEELQEVIQNRNYSWIKLYVLFLNPITIGDNLDAAANRNESQESVNRSQFTKELEVALGYDHDRV